MEQVLEPIEKLEAMGFRKAADWCVEAGALECLFLEHATAQNILYAFVADRVCPLRRQDGAHPQAADVWLQTPCAYAIHQHQRQSPHS